jgi:hypothetical protein
VEGQPDPNAVIQAIEDAGFDAALSAEQTA